MRYVSFIITLLITGNILAGFNRLKDDPKLKERAGGWMKAVPVKFLENKGQMTDINGALVPFVLFKIEGNGADTYITEKGLTYVFIKSEEDDDEHEEEKNKLANYSRIDMDLKNASIKKENIIKEGPSEANFNYFFGHCPQGIYGVKQYEKITIKNIYPHIDWTLYNSNSNGFKYDFIVHPGADPGQIELVYSSLNPLKLNKNGNIEVKTESGSLTENNPVSFQNKINIETKFIKTLNRRNIHNGYDTHIKFSLENYDKTQTLIIDPQLFWGTYYGGNGLDNFCNVSTDIYGNVLVTGYTGSFNYFPTKSSGTAYYQSVMPNSSSVPIAKFNNNGVLLWATLYAGGTCGSYAIDGGTCIDSDPSGNIYVTGITTCAAFPTQNMAGAYFQAPAAGVSRPFILKFDNSGNRLWATTFGGSLSGPTGPGAGNSKYLALDATGNLFLCGYGLNGLPTANPGGGAYTQAAGGGYDMFFSKFSPAGVLTWSTYFGGSGYEAANAITIDNSNNLIATGYTESANLPLASPGGSAYTDNTYNGSGDAVLVKFSNNGNLLWSTYFGGSAFDSGYAIDCDATGNIYTTGETASAAFPAQNPGAGAYFDNTFNGVIDIYVAKFLNNNSLFWSTYYGGTAGEGAATGQGAKPLSMSYGKMGIVADNCGNVYATGSTGSSDFPVFNNTACSSFYSSTFGGAFILKFNSLGVRTWATFCGPSASFGSGIATDINNNIFAVGEWWWSSTSVSNTLLNPGGGAYFQATPNGPIGSDDGFVIKFIPDPPSHTQSHVNPGSCICNGSTTVNITSTCSTPPYNYLWSNGTQALNTGSATNTITGLCPGNYSVTITDAACNRDTVSYLLVGASGSISLASTQKNISCGSSCDGNAAILPTGGVAPYTYSWSGSGGQTTQTITGLCAGTYSVTVKDVSNCTSIYNFNITQIPYITLSVSSTPSCSGATATANVVNGVPPYIYTWSNAQTTQTATGLNTGNYTVTVYDANGICSASTSVAVQGKPALSTSSTNFSCTTSGYAQVWAVNGVPTNNVNPLPYTYTWSGGETTYYIYPASAGNYTVTVNDGNGCTATQVFTITGTNPLSANFTSSSACTGSPVNFTNTGTPPNTGVAYIWRISPNPNTGTITTGTTTNFSYTFLTAGSYTITHQVDSGGCTRAIAQNITITNCSAAPTVTATGSSVCPGTCGTATSNSSGGTGPYTYSWSTGATTQNINPCPASTTTYTVKVTDSGGNTATTTTTVIIKPPLTITSTPTNIVCSGGTGSASALGGNGSLPYTYNWSNGQTNQNSTGLSAGNYTVTATDATGCSVSSTVVINSPLPLTGQFSKGTANCAACGCKEWIMVSAVGGTSPYSYSWPDGYINRYKNQLCPDSYNINIKDKNGCSVNMNVIAP